MGYYGVPSLSLRLAIHHELQLQPDLLHQVWWPEEIWKDQLHPTCIGHRYGRRDAFCSVLEGHKSGTAHHVSMLVYPYC